MSFNTSTSPKRDIRNIALIEETENPQEILNNLQNKFLEFNRDYDEILDYYNSLPNMTRKQYDKIHDQK